MMNRMISAVIAAMSFMLMSYSNAHAEEFKSAAPMDKPDCLADICLGTKGIKPSEDVPFKGPEAMTWLRKVEVCSNQVVSVSIAVLFMVDPPKGTPGFYATLDEGKPASELFDTVGATIVAKGWTYLKAVTTGDPNKDSFLALSKVYSHPDKSSPRLVRYSRLTTESADIWGVSIFAQSLDYDSICAAERSRGL